MRNRGEWDKVCLHFHTYAFMTNHLLAVILKTNHALHMASYSGKKGDKSCLLTLPCPALTSPDISLSAAFFLSFFFCLTLPQYVSFFPSIALLHSPLTSVPFLFLPGVSLKRTDLLTDLTAIITLSRGCEALQRSVDEYYRQVRNGVVWYRGIGRGKESYDVIIMQSELSDIIRMSH